MQHPSADPSTQPTSSTPSPLPPDVLSEQEAINAATQASQMLSQLGAGQSYRFQPAASPKTPAVSPLPPAAKTPAPLAPRNDPANQYLRSKILTATPEQLQLMLYDGAIRFAEQGKIAIQQRDYERSYELLTRAQRILTELQCSLRPELAPELAKNLASLYTFAYLRLVDANISQSTAKVDDALKVLRYQRETWAMVMEQQTAEKAAEVAGTDGAISEDDAAAKVRQHVQATVNHPPRLKVQPDGSRISLAG